MRLFLIRHGETVDNVAQVFGGSRDSPLTTHGVLQARRLASHLSKHFTKPSSSSNTPEARIFSSPLQRAAKTAEAIRGGKEDCVWLQLSQLREKDFGSHEGAKFGTRKEYPDDAESSESMRGRVDEFLEDHLLDLVDSDKTVFVVAHGIILGVLVRRLCERLSRGATTVSAEAQRATSSFPTDGVPILPSWSNTGYLEAVISSSGVRTWSALKLHIACVNSVDHLKGLRKTRGGIGSARFDDKQRTMDTFFAPKKRKLADATD